jgi:hypothetical protein
MAKIALCLIVKDAARTIERCLASAAPYVDEIDVYDTGSTDDTIALLEQRSATGNTPVRIERGEWRDDFAWARRQSFAMPSPDVDWLLWLDSDDELVGGARLRPLAASAPPEVDGFAVFYDCDRDPLGRVVDGVWRLRLVRRDAGYRWEGVVHEGLFPPDGPVGEVRPVPPEDACVVHRPLRRERPGERNIGLLTRAEAETRRRGERPAPRLLLSLALELSDHGRFDEAAPRYREFLADGDGWSDERAYAVHRLAACVRLMGRPSEAIRLEEPAAAERADWPELSLGLAESHLALGNGDEAERWARRSLETDLPQTPLRLDRRWLELGPRLRLLEAQLRTGTGKAIETVAELRLRTAADEWLVAKLGEVETELAGGNTAAAAARAREAAGRYDPWVRAMATALHTAGDAHDAA